MNAHPPEAAHASAPARGRVARVTAFVALVCAAAVLLPVSALVVEALAERAENWILVLQLVLVVGLGALGAVLVPRLGPAAWPPAARAALWAGVGLVAAMVANAGWLLLVAG